MIKFPYPGMTSGNTALLVIDVVNACCHESCEMPQWNIFFSKIRQMIPRLEDFIQVYKKKAGGVVVYTNIVPWQKDFLPDNLNLLYATNPDAMYYSSDTTGFAEKFYLVKPTEEDLIITKRTYDAFSEPSLHQALQARGIKYLLFTGVFGDGCVFATIQGAFSRGYHLVMLADLIETTDVPERQAMQRELKQNVWPTMFGKTLDSIGSHL